MFDRVFEVSEYEPGVPFVAEGYAVTATKVPHYTLDAYALKLTDGSRTLAYSGDAGPGPRSSRRRAEPISFSARRRWPMATSTGSLAGICRSRRRRRRSRSRAPSTLLVTHRPAELPVPHNHLLAFDGLQIEV